MRDHDAVGRMSRLVAAAGGVLLLLTLLGGAATAAEPLSLEQCEELAILNNPGLAAARYQLKSTEGNRLSASSAFLPSLSVSTGFTHSETGPGAFVFEGVSFPIAASKSEYYTIRGNLSQNIVHLPSLYRYRAAGEDVAYSAESMRAAQADVIFGVRQGYYLLLKAILLAEVAKDALAVSEEQLRKSEALFELGSVARTDVLSARVNRATKVQEEISARNAIESARAQLAVVLGYRVGEPFDIRLDLVDPPDADPLDEEILIEQALQERPEVRRARAQLSGANKRKSAAFWDQFPTLGGSAYYSKQGDRFSYVIPTGEVEKDASWGFSVGFNWYIFDGFQRIGGVRTAKANLAAAREETRRQELDAALNVREARIQINNARETIRAAEESVELAAENLKLHEALYENGGGTILELNTAQVDHTTARNSLVEARVGLHLAYAELDRALGR